MRMAVTCLTTALLLAGVPAGAQKAGDTLRIAINDPIEALSPYDRPNEETAPFYSEMHQTLIARDEHNDKLVGVLAKSWKRIDEKTLEFELRDNLTFHSGNTFTAADVVHTFNWAADPKVKLPNKGPYLWVDRVEKTGTTTVRVRAKQLYAADLTALAYRFFILDSKVHKDLENTADYGRVSGSGTGPYRMVSLDRNKGAVLERWDGFKGDAKVNRAPIKRIHGIPVPDPQTQIAQLITGGVDVLRNVTADTAKELAKKPELKVTSVPSGTYLYIHIDSIARSGFKPLTDPRVRKAFVMAINPKEIADNFIAGADKAEIMETVCFKWTTSCTWTTKPYPYNPTLAKKLLAEAGYPDGLEIPFWVHAPYKDAAEAVAGQLRVVGIRSSVQPLTISVYFKKRDDGELTTFMGVRPTASFPEVLSAFDSYFNPRRDYWKDEAILAAWKAARGEIDEVKRAKLVQPALDRINTEAYVLPITSVPTVFVHAKDVRVERNLTRAANVNVSDFFWN